MGGGGREPHIIDPKYCKMEGAARVYQGCYPTLTSRDFKDPLMVTKDIGIEVIANTRPSKVADRTRILSGGGYKPEPSGNRSQRSSEDRCIVVGNTNPSGNGMNGNCYFSEGVNPTLTCNKNEGNRVAIPVGNIETKPSFNQRGTVHDYNGISRTLNASHDGNQPKVAIPVLTPDRATKKQNGRRFKEDGEEAFTLTAQDRHGVAIAVDTKLKCIGGIYGSVSKAYQRGVYEGGRDA